MENNDHDCLFVVVDDGSRLFDKLFQRFYPLLYRIKNFPGHIFLISRRLISKVIDKAYLEFIISDKY